MQTYRRFVSYVYQYENGKKAGNRGFIKVEARGNTCSMQIALKGICRDGNGSCRIYGFKREEGLLKGSLLAECPVRTGIVQEQLGFLRNEMGDARYSLHELSGVIFRGDDETMYGTQWDDAPMKMENFQPDERGAKTAVRETAPETPQEENAQEWAGGGSPGGEERDEMPQETEGMGPEAEEAVWEEAVQTASPEEDLAQEAPDGEQTAGTGSAEEMPTETVSMEEVSEEASAEVWSAEAVPVEETHAGAVHMEADLHEEPSADTIPAESTSVGASFIEESAIEEPPVMGSAMEELSVEESAIEEPPVMGSAMEEPPVEEPAMRGPFIEDPAIDGPFTKSPHAESPHAESQIIEQTQAEGAVQEENFTEALPPAGEAPQGDMSPREMAEETPMAEIPASRWQEEGLPEVLDTTVVLPDLAEGAEASYENTYEDPEENDADGETPEEAPEDVLKNIAHIKAEMEAKDIQAQDTTKKDTFCPFTDGVLEDCKKLSMEDLRYLDPRDQGLRNNRFVQHGHQMFGHLLLAKVARNSQYILGVPGMYQKQERFMADMYGFHNFKCAKRRGNRPACFGYWYRLIYPPQLDRRDGRQE